MFSNEVDQDKKNRLIFLTRPMSVAELKDNWTLCITAFRLEVGEKTWKRVRKEFTVGKCDCIENQLEKLRWNREKQLRGRKEEKKMGAKLVRVEGR